MTTPTVPRAALAVLFAVSWLGCGAKSGLESPELDGGPTDAMPLECTRDVHCDDGVACTADVCVEGRCTARPEDERCDDGSFCTGAERCDPNAGCVSAGSPCADGVACTEDLCDEVLDECRFEPRAGLCPLSHRCDPVDACVARALVHDTVGRLFEIDVPSGATRPLGSVSLSLVDIALAPDGRIFATTPLELFEVELEGPVARFIAPLDVNAVALDIHPDGGLVGAAEQRVFRIDRDSGETRDFNRLPMGTFASGDIAFVGGRMLLTTTDVPFAAGTNDELYEVPLDGADPIRLGFLDAGCVWALAPFGETLYGFDCEGNLLDIDPRSGAAQRLGFLGDVTFGGGASR